MKSQWAKIWETKKSLGDNQLPFSWEESDTWKQPRRKLKGSENNKQKCPISGMRKRTGPPLTKWKEKGKPYADERATDSVMEEAVAGFCYQVKSSNALKNSRQKKPPETTRRLVACLGNSWRRSKDGYWNCSIGLFRRKPLPQYGWALSSPYWNNGRNRRKFPHADPSFLPRLWGNFWKSSWRTDTAIS